MGYASTAGPQRNLMTQLPVSLSRRQKKKTSILGFLWKLHTGAFFWVTIYGSFDSAVNVVKGTF